jgi:hypothetical protein
MRAVMRKTSIYSKRVTGASSNEEKIEKLLRGLKADPRFVPIVGEFENRVKTPRGKFGSNGLKVNGKLFALFTQGTLVVKLPRVRVLSLVAEGVGKPFDPGHGRLMKGWLTVINPRVSWLDLVKEALLFVSDGS